MRWWWSSAPAPAVARSPTSCARRASRWSASKPARCNRLRAFINDEWKSFVQLAWLDKRTTSGNWRVAKDFAGLPAWICKTVGGTTTHWAGASLRLRRARVQGAHRLRRDRRREPARLAADAQGARAVLRQGRRQDGRDAHQRHPRPAGQQQLQGHVRRREEARLQGLPHRQHGDQQRAAPRPRALPAARLLLPGLQERRQVVHAVHRDSEGRGHRQLRAAPAIACDARSSTTMPARSPASSTWTRTARSSGRRRARSAWPAIRSRRRGCCCCRPRPSTRTGWPTHRARSAATTCAT